MFNKHIGNRLVSITADCSEKSSLSRVDDEKYQQHLLPPMKCHVKL
jgi:hypothetical protein